MKQANLDRAVASATGESIRFVRSMGFSLMPMPRVSYQPFGWAIRLQEALEGRAPAGCESGVILFTFCGKDEAAFCLVLSSFVSAQIGFIETYWP